MISIFDGQRLISGFLGVGICQSLNEINDLALLFFVSEPMPWIFQVTNLIGEIVGG